MIIVRQWPPLHRLTADAHVANLSTARTLHTAVGTTHAIPTVVDARAAVKHVGVASQVGGRAVLQERPLHVVQVCQLLPCGKHHTGSS